MYVAQRRYSGRTMTGKKDHDATKNLDPDEPTEVTEKGLKIGVPLKKDVLAALEKVARKQRG
jgi:hypothetical protein